MSSARANLPIFILAAVEIAIGIMLIVNPVGFQFLLIRIIGIAFMVLGVIFLIRFITGWKNRQQAVQRYAEIELRAKYFLRSPALKITKKKPWEIPGLLFAILYFLNSPNHIYRSAVWTEHSGMP